MKKNTRFRLGRNLTIQARWALGILLVCVAVLPTFWLIVVDLNTSDRLSGAAEARMRYDARMIAERLQQFTEDILYQETLMEVTPVQAEQTGLREDVLGFPFTIAFADTDTEPTDPALDALMGSFKTQVAQASMPGQRSVMRGYIDGPDGPFHFIYTYDAEDEGVVMRGAKVNPEVVKASVLPRAFRMVAEGMKMSRGRDMFGEGIIALEITTPDTTLVLSELDPSFARGNQAFIDEMTSSFDMSGLFPGWSVRVACFNEVKAKQWQHYAASFIPLLILVLGIFFTSRVAMREMELSTAKSTFVSNVSHELKMPLAKIQFFNELIQRLPHEAREKHQRYHSAINQECDRLSMLVDNILDFNRIERGQMKYEFTATAIAELAQDVAESVTTLYGTRGYNVAVHLKPNLPVVAFDNPAMRQALINLLSNAVKYSEPHTIELLVYPTEMLGKPAVALAVRDQGIGVPRDKQARIFDEFYRVDSGLSQRVSGSGLGLALVRHIAEAHGGNVRVESTEGEGATFTLTLPVRNDA